MPASTRARQSRTTSSSRPYDRPSPAASPTEPQLHLSRQSPPPALPTEDPECPPDHPGLPTYAEYKCIEAGYLLSLSTRKRDKALITQAMFDKIWDVLHQPDACTVETPQFRFWVRKMFTLSRPASSDGDGEGWPWRWDGAPGTHPRNEDDTDLELERAMGIGHGANGDAALLTSAVVLHENRPVAIKEQLYELFCYCHVRAGHGGRDKTCAVIREHYSWVPKELTAQFVKACPTCALKRSVGGGVLLQRRVVSSGGRERRQTAPATGTVPAPLEWPTTEGPLDPANPHPCGVRERLRGVSDSPSLSSPVRNSRMESTTEGASPGGYLSSGGWSGVSGLTTLPSPFGARELARTIGNTGFSPQRLSVSTQHSPEKTGSLPSLASALSNESLDDEVKLSRHGPYDGAGACLPPALRPLRLSGPVASTTKPDDPDFFPIDPVLLSFNYPGLRCDASPGFGGGRPSSAGFASPPQTLVPMGAGPSEARGYPGDSLHLRVRRARENSGSDHTTTATTRMMRMMRMMPTLDTPDSPTTRVERAAATVASAPSTGPALCGDPSPSRRHYHGHGCDYDYDYDYGYDCGRGYGPERPEDGPLVRLLPCATDSEAASQDRGLDGTLSRCSILADA